MITIPFLSLLSSDPLRGSAKLDNQLKIVLAFWPYAMYAKKLIKFNIAIYEWINRKGQA